MSDEETKQLDDALLSTLASLNGGAQHVDLLAALGWEPEQYAAVKDRLLAAKAVKPRRGRGGGIALPDYAAKAGKPKVEKKLPPPMPE